MKKEYTDIKDIVFLNSNSKNKDDYYKLFNEGLFSDQGKWNNYKLYNKIDGMGNDIDSRLRNRMSDLSLGVYNVLENGPGKDIQEDNEFCLFTGFGEIETTDKILKNIIIDKYSHVSPTLFHNSVHHTSLGYYTIIKKIHNPCMTISDGLKTNLSFINYIKLRIQLNKVMIIVGGDESSSFFNLDKNNPLTIVPSYVAYKILPKSDKGFSFGGIVDNFEDLINLDSFKKSKYIFADKDTFIKLKEKIADKEIITEYPIVQDNPCGVIFRLAFPFYFNIKGLSLVVDKVNDKIFYFEVLL